jgi:hypothetical protein
VKPAEPKTIGEENIEDTPAPAVAVIPTVSETSLIIEEV